MTSKEQMFNKVYEKEMKKIYLSREYMQAKMITFDCEEEIFEAMKDYEKRDELTILLDNYDSAKDDLCDMVTRKAFQLGLNTAAKILNVDEKEDICQWF